MTERLYPAAWKTCMPETATAGGVIPLQGPSTDLPGTCPNCENVPPGLLYGWHLDPTSKVALPFLVGGVRLLFPGHLQEIPCPVCGVSGPKATGMLPKPLQPRPYDDRPAYWDKP